MQLLPTTPHAPTHAIRRGHRERREQHEGQEADRDKGTLDDILEDCAHQNALVEHQPGQEVHEYIEKREETEHASKARKPVPAGQSS